MLEWDKWLLVRKTNNSESWWSSFVRCLMTEKFMFSSFIDNKCYLSFFLN